MKVNKRSLIEGLSYALDMAEKSHFSHGKHVAYTSIMIGKELNLTNAEQKDLYFLALLHDIGAKKAYAIETHDANVVANHCIVGRDLILELPIRTELAECIYYHHEYFDGTGPFKKQGYEIPLFSQIICLANAFDLYFGENESFSFEVMESVLEWINTNKKHYDPKIVEAFQSLVEKEVILLDYFNIEFNDIIASKVDVQGDYLEYQDIKAYADVLSKIIDNRSPFTYTHSMGLASLVLKTTTALGYDEETINKMHIAALLHDIGKLAISNDIIEKPGSLDSKERFEINKHTYYTRWILKQIEGFEEITEYASNHHEKLTGKGYPQQLKAHEISRLDRIVTICDIFQALTEERPYRKNMPIEKVWSIIDSMVDSGELDSELVAEFKVILADEYK